MFYPSHLEGHVKCVSSRHTRRISFGRKLQWICHVSGAMLQGISGPQKFQIHKSYGPQDRLPSAHTCFNQLDILEYDSKEQLNDRLMVAIHEGSEGFGFG